MTRVSVKGAVSKVPGAGALKGDSLRALALRGSVWTMGGFGTKQLLKVVSNLALAWLLVPEAFGLMAMIIVVQQGLKMFSDIGIGPSIIQNPRGMEPAFLNTAWTIQIIRGFVLWAVACVLAWPMAALYSQNDPLAGQLLYLLPVAALTSVISGFNSPAAFTLNRRLWLGRLTLLELAAKLVTIVVAVSWALVHPTVWAIIAGTLSASVFKLVVSHRLDPEVKVRVQWDRECAGELFGFGKWVFLSTAFTFLALHLDKLLLGALLPMEALGLYFIAQTFAKVALNVSERLGGTVLFPVLARFRDDHDKMVRKCLEARRLVLLAGGTACVGFALMAPWFFGLLYRDDYAGAGVIAQWISVYMWAAILLVGIQRVPLAMGNSRTVFVLNVVRSLGVLAAVGGYVLAGLPGFIVGMASGPLLAQVYVVWWMPTRRAEVVRQSVWMTVGFGAYLGLALVVMNWAMGAMAWGAALGVAAGLAGLLAGPVLWWIWREVVGDAGSPMRAPVQ